MDNWEEKISLLREYKKVHGHLAVSKASDQKLASRTYRVRIQYNSDQLLPQQVRELMELGFIFNPGGDKWNANVKALLRFKEKFGSFKVPRSYGDGSLLQFVYRVRHASKWKLARERIDELDRIGFCHGRDVSTGALLKHIRVVNRNGRNI
jgi:hypothetical protein